MTLNAISVGPYLVELCTRKDAPPHAFAVRAQYATDDSSYFRSGCLWWQGQALDDFGGVSALPGCVAEALTQEGYTVPESVRLQANFKMEHLHAG